MPQTSEARRAQKRAYNHTPKGRERQARYNLSRKGRERSARYRAHTLDVRIAGVEMTYHVPPEKKAELVSRLAEYRGQQREERHARLRQTVA